MVSPVSVAVDVGGTKIAAGLVDGNGDVSGRREAATPRTGFADVLGVTCDLVADLIRAADGRAIAIGVAAPGVIDTPTGRVRAGTETLPGWVGAPVKEVLEQRLRLPTAVENDAKVMAYGELHRGAAREYADVLFVSVGTGVGGAVSRDGVLFRGRRGNAGEIAHLLVPVTGAVPCGCGRFDHLEAVAAGPAIAAEYARRASDVVPLPVIAQRSAGGDAVAAACIREAATWLGRALAGVVTAMDFDAVVIGGGVAQLGEQLLGPVRRAVESEVLDQTHPPAVVIANLGLNGPLVGAGLLALTAMQEAHAQDGGSSR